MKNNQSNTSRAMIYESVRDSSLKEIRNMRQKAHDTLCLYFDLSSDQLQKQLPVPTRKTQIIEQAMLDSMLEGDQILHTDPTLKIRYYSDNLRPERKSSRVEFKS